MEQELAHGLPENPPFFIILLLFIGFESIDFSIFFTPKFSLNLDQVCLLQIYYKYLNIFIMVERASYNWAWNSYRDGLLHIKIQHEPRFNL